MKISLIHPSRGRAEKSWNTVSYWLSQAYDLDSIEVIVSIDYNDPQYNDYYTRYNSQSPIKIVPGHNTSVVEATNRAVKHASGDILIYLSDDFKCPEYWDKLVVANFIGEDRPLLLKVDDCLQPFDVAVLTIPIMNRALYERLGYFWHPGYKSMFVDECLYWTVRKLGAMKNAPHLKFPHEHVSIGKAQDDETYRRSAANWDQGKEIFAKHKAAGFPI